MEVLILVSILPVAQLVGDRDTRILLVSLFWLHHYYMSLKFLDFPLIISPRYPVLALKCLRLVLFDVYNICAFHVACASRCRCLLDVHPYSPVLLSSSCLLSLCFLRSICTCVFNI
uniref:Uncharacterized protein n=1 Tax=Schistocephalus solidus TaxID=70667 RepID=A0A0X3PPK0_SCHSO